MRLKKLLLVAFALTVAAMLFPGVASAECEIINGTGEPLTPEKEAEWREREAKCRAEAEARRAQEAQEEAEKRAAREAAVAGKHPCEALYGTEIEQPEFCVSEQTGWWVETTEECKRLVAQEADELLIDVCLRVEALQKARQLPRERRAERRRREWERKPTVTRSKATRLIQHRMAREVEGWKHRTAGSIDCRGGRVDRTHWRCKVRWIHKVPGGEVCRIGRFKVRGAGYRNGVPWYWVGGQWLVGYGFVDSGRIRCYA